MQNCVENDILVRKVLLECLLLLLDLLEGATFDLILFLHLSFLLLVVLLTGLLEIYLLVYLLVYHLLGLGHVLL